MEYFHSLISTEREPLLTDSEVVLRVLNGKLHVTREKVKESQDLKKISNKKQLKMYAANGAWSSEETKLQKPNSCAPLAADYYPSIQNAFQKKGESSDAVSETETIQRFLSVCLQQFADGSSNDHQSTRKNQTNEVIKLFQSYIEILYGLKN